MSYTFECISDLIFMETQVEKADLLLIPGGSHPQVMEKAAALYHRGMAPLLLPSGGPNVKLPQFTSEWEFLKEIGIKLGVPEQVILKEEKAKHTFDNANLSLKVLEENHIKIQKAILVCKAFHARRAWLTYRTVFPEEIELYVAPVPDQKNITKDNWFLDSYKIHTVMGEVVKIGQYFEEEISKWVEKERKE